MKIEFRGQTNNGEYAYGDLVDGKYIFTGYSEDGDLMLCEINPETLSLNFEDMLDSQGNKIFASLSEDGKGGDILFCSGFGKNTVIYANRGIRFLGYEKHKEVADFQFERVIGIKE